MVNSKSQQDYKEYNSYYRPNQDDDDLTFFPSQGVVPRYYFENGFLRGTVEPHQIAFMEHIELEDDIVETHSSNYFSLIFFFVCLTIFFYTFKNVFKFLFTLIDKK